MRYLKKKGLDGILLLIIFVLSASAIFLHTRLLRNYQGINENNIENLENLEISRYKSLWDYEILEKNLYSIATSSDSNYTVVGTGEFLYSNSSRVGGIYLFHRSNSTPVWIYKTGHEVFSVDISSNGNYIVASGDKANGDKVYLFNNSSPNPIWNFSVGRHVRSVAISQDGNYIIAGGHSNGTDDYSIWVFHRSSPTPLWNYTHDWSSFTKSLKISSNGNYILEALERGIFLYHISNSTPLWEYYYGDDDINSIDISSDGEYIVIGGTQHTMYTFHKSSSTPLWNYTMGDDVNSVAISSDGNQIVAGGNDRTIYLFNTSNPKPIRTFRTVNSIEFVDISNDSALVTVVDIYGFMYFINTSDDWGLVKITALEGTPKSFTISNNGSYILIGIDRELKIFYEDYNYSDIPPTSTHPDDISIFKGETETTNITLFDDFIEIPFIQCFYHNYSIPNYDFQFNTTRHFDEYFSLLNGNQIFYEAFKVIHTNPGGKKYYLYEHHYDIDFANKILSLIPEIRVHPSTGFEYDANPITAHNSNNGFYLRFQPSSLYRVLRNGSIWVNWDYWDSNETITIPIDRFTPGVYNYTIEYFDSNLQFGASQSVIVSINIRQRIANPQKPFIFGFNSFFTLGIMGISILLIIKRIIRKK